MNRNDIRRLEKAARDKNKQKLVEWGTQFENYIKEDYRRRYEKLYQEVLDNSVENFITAVAYTVVYSEEIKVDARSAAGFMEDLFVTVDMFRTGEYTPSDYKAKLEADGVFIKEYDHNYIYKRYIKNTDTDFAKYMIGNGKREIITILGIPKYKDIIKTKQFAYTLAGKIIYIDDIHINDIPKGYEIIPEEEEDNLGLMYDKLLISDKIILIGEEKDDLINKYVDFAIAHNKVIEQLPTSLD